MSLTAIPSRNFAKKSAKLPSKVKDALAERLRIFMQDPHAEVLNNHILKGSLKNYRSINITGDYRLIYEEYDDTTVRLINIGRHSELFGK